MELEVKCEECGADLAYKPGTKALTCNYCNHTMEFDSPDSTEEAHNELDLNNYLAHFDEQSQHVERYMVSCKNCGAETELDSNQQSGSCPFCDTPLVVTQAHTKALIKPKGLLPFKIEKKEARKNFLTWLSKLWFAPNDLKKQVTKHDKFKGIYLPYWTYDCDTYSGYTGQRGDYYYVTVQGRDKDGNSTSRRERRTRWRFVSGNVRCAFDDVLVPATKSLPNDKLNALEPWDLPALVDYKDEYLSGYVTESYQVDLKEGYKVAQGIMDDRIRVKIRYDIGGDEQRIMSVNTSYTSATFKHVLLPVWVSAYRYKDKLYQILVNARTGEVQGQRPWSWVKIGLLSLVVISVIGGLIYFGHVSQQ